MKSYFSVLAVACAFTVTPVSAFAAPAGAPVAPESFPKITVTSTQARLTDKYLALDATDQSFVVTLKDPAATPAKPVAVPADKYRVGVNVKDASPDHKDVLKAFHTLPADDKGETKVTLPEKLKVGEYKLIWQVESIENPAQHAEPATVALKVITSPKILSKQVTTSGSTTTVELSVNATTDRVGWAVSENHPKKGGPELPVGYAQAKAGKVSFSFATPKHPGLHLTLTPLSSDNLFPKSSVVTLPLTGDAPKPSATPSRIPTPSASSMPTRTPVPVPSTDPIRTTDPAPTSAPTRTTEPATPERATTSTVVVKEDLITKTLVALGVKKVNRPLAHTGVNN